jgi:hypothetical protein
MPPEGRRQQLASWRIRELVEVVTQLRSTVDKLGNK